MHTTFFWRRAAHPQLFLYAGVLDDPSAHQPGGVLHSCIYPQPEPIREDRESIGSIRFRKGNVEITWTLSEADTGQVARDLTSY